MPEAKNQTAAKPRTRTAKTNQGGETAATEPAQSAPAPDKAETVETTATTKTAATAKTAASKPAQPAPAPDNAENGNRLTVVIPLDGALVGTAVKAATLPLTAAKKVAQKKNGFPAYAAVGGLAVLGAVEWPVAAAGGLGLAVLRRWGPLKPAADQDTKKTA